MRARADSLDSSDSFSFRATLSRAECAHEMRTWCLVILRPRRVRSGIARGQEATTRVASFSSAVRVEQSTVEQNAHAECPEGPHAAGTLRSAFFASIDRRLKRNYQLSAHCLIFFFAVASAKLTPPLSATFRGGEKIFWGPLPMDRKKKKISAHTR